ncbi:A-kinase anchoring protein pkaap isoform X1 [Lasioglossum baleicum]|uniref:A-kinase anchoring protein pkaap isoform X1 n=1 Tax=Lasioglossum baleicum TaxID=434251 RepID=UPI003FCDFA89
MFPFFKKSGRSDKLGSLQASPIEPTSSGNFFGHVFNGSSSVQTSTGVQCSLEEEEENRTFNGEDAWSFSSQLSKTLPQILADKGALGYFIQFVETRNCLALIKFWLEVECLCSSFNIQETRMESETDSRLSSTVDDNKNFHCRVTRNNSDELDNTLFGEYVNNNDKKSNRNDMPKTSQTISRTGQSNYNCKRRDMTRQDALRIHKKYIVKDTLGINQIPEDLKTEMEKALACENIEPMLQCLSAVQHIVYNILENEHINDFLRSEFNCKHQIDVLTSGNVQLTDILYNETAFFYFMEFMELENKRELLDFWMSAINFKQNLLEKKDAADPEEAQADALIIYEKYFSLQATKPLGFSDIIRFQVEENICHEDGEGPRPDCFDKPCKIVYNFLNKHYLPTFLSSQLYYKYLSELINTIQSSPCSSMHPRIKRAGSDCSSVSSISINTQSTLQAGNEGKSANSKGAMGDGMNIDTRQLYDPDSLWRRNKYSLSVGYVDALGRFITEIEPDPQRKCESRLARVVKRLVNMEDDKAKEELAWKIAEMIVREITSLTLGASNFSS